MMFVSTRGNFPPVTSSQAISLGMVPQGGLFVPPSLPSLSPTLFSGKHSYRDVAQSVFELLLTDFTSGELRECIDHAYTSETFDVPSVIKMVEIDDRRTIMELWHGPTAAFKDVALQIMPHLLACAKRKTGNTLHTMILVATSGDTGKAALEGFRNAPGISIMVFYPHGGVSEIQRLQMVTTDGDNTHVAAVRGNFDDCQTGVKELFADPLVRAKLRSSGIELSSANSINWGRLCPQIVYYVSAYADAVKRKRIKVGDEVDFCVPTGNFGNLLAGYYARCMGLPIGRLYCASNKNRVLSDFFATGIYDRRRDFYRTNSPSMDILISSNLERFLFAVTGGDAPRVNEWYDGLERNGMFTVDDATRRAIGDIVVADWIDEDEVLSTIASVHRRYGYLPDTHTAVGIAQSERHRENRRHMIIASTASPYKFSSDVLGALEHTSLADEFASIERLSVLSGTPVHRAMRGLRERRILHDQIIDVGQMPQAALDIITAVR